jgi:hypothetical protein
MGSKKQPGNRRRFLKQFYRKLIFKQKKSWKKYPGGLDIRLFKPVFKLI